MKETVTDVHGAERLELIAGGAKLTLREAVRELLSCADDNLRGSGQRPRPPEAHGGAYLDRWRWERLRKAYETNEKGFSAVEKELQETPATWVPALLRTLIQTAMKKKVFKDGGLEVFVQGVLGK